MRQELNGAAAKQDDFGESSSSPTCVHHMLAVHATRCLGLSKQLHAACCRFMLTSKSAAATCAGLATGICLNSCSTAGSTPADSIML
jgi:hypothetical protein